MTVPQILTLTEFLADKDAVVEWHMLPVPADEHGEDDWAPDMDDAAW